MKRKNYNLMIGGRDHAVLSGSCPDRTVLDAVWDDDDGLHGSQSGAVCAHPLGTDNFGRDIFEPCDGGKRQHLFLWQSARF